MFGGALLGTFDVEESATEKKMEVKSVERHFFPEFSEFKKIPQLSRIEENFQYFRGFQETFQGCNGVSSQR